MSNYIHYKVRDAFTYYFPKSFRYGQPFLSHTLQGMRLPVPAGLKQIFISNRCPRRTSSRLHRISGDEIAYPCWRTKNHLIAKITLKSLIWNAQNPKIWTILVSSCSCLCQFHWSWVQSRKLRCSWSSADRRCSNFIWMTMNIIAC